MPGSDLTEDDPFDPETDDFLHRSMTKERRYRHFDDPIPDSIRKAGFALAAFGKKHQFRPLLGFTDEKRRVFRDNDGKLQTNTKPRPIRYASHQDAAYMQAYSEYLSTRYEAALSAHHLGQSVLAYRPTGLTNIHHAKSLFDEIRQRSNCNVVAVDISGFFDTLVHSHLRSELCRVLGAEKLEGHDWHVFRNITRYAWVETTDLDAVLGKKRTKGSRICKPHDFDRHVRGRKSGLVQVRPDPHGIPQGTPISGLYANIYLLSFDQRMAELSAKLGGSYRRYSDDIALVVPSDVDGQELVDVVQKHLADFDLCLSEDKTDMAKFTAHPLACDHPIQYLGFVFDGQTTTIRDSSLNRYREKMRSGIHAKMVAAKAQRIPSNQVYQREVRSRYTHLGKRRNFMQYAYRASEILDAPEIRQQVKAHVTWFERAWERERNRVYGGLILS